MKIKTVVSKRLQNYMSKPAVLHGVIGDITTGDINVPNRTSIIYVTLYSGQVLNNVLNLRVPNLLGLRVRIGFDENDLPNTLQVLGARGAYYGANDDTTKGVAFHNKQHQWPYADTVHVSGEQFLPSLFSPISGTLTVSIYPGIYIIATGYLHHKVTTIVDMAPSIATITLEHARLSVIVVDDTGAFQVRDGNLVDQQDSPFISAYEMLTDADLPALTSGDTPICAVKLYYGQLELWCNGQRNDFIDMRFAASAGGGGAPPGGGHTIQDEGTDRTQRTNLNFVGDGVTVTDGGGVSDDTIVTIPGGGGHEIQESDGTPMATEPALKFVGDVVLSDDPAVSTVVTISATNHFFVDQSGGTGDSYGVLAGARNGVNVEFTVSQGAYVSGTVTVLLNGQLQTQGTAEDWHEASAVAGTIHFTTAPEATDEITVIYGYLGIVSVPTAQHTIQEEGGNLTARTKLNFIGANVTAVDNAGNDATDVTVKTLVVHAQMIFTIEGLYLAAADQGLKPLRIRAPYVGAGATIEEIYAQLNTTPGAANLRLDIHKNGSTIFTGTAYVEIAPTGYTVSRTTNFDGGGAFAKDDYFQLELVQGDTDAADLVVHVRYKWTLTDV